MLITLGLSLFKIKRVDMCLAAEGRLEVFTLWSLPYLCSNGLPIYSFTSRRAHSKRQFRNLVILACSTGMLHITPFITVTFSRAKHSPRSMAFTSHFFQFRWKRKNNQTDKCVWQNILEKTGSYSSSNVPAMSALCSWMRHTRHTTNNHLMNQFES